MLMLGQNESVKLKNNVSRGYKETLQNREIIVYLRGFVQKIDKICVAFRKTTKSV